MKWFYISDYLTHWTGRDKSDKDAFKILKSIVSKKRLLLKYNPHFNLNSLGTTANLKMTCFTDIPLYLAREHCKSYGEFGISFKRNNLGKYGANPVFYMTEERRKDTTKIYDFICNQVKGIDPKIPENIQGSLERFFGFVQDYSLEGEFLYYEREWRILENNLKIQEKNEGNIIVSSDFSDDEFGILNDDKIYYIDALCKVIDDDNYNIHLKALNTIDRLNELLNVSNLYDILQTKKSDRTFSEKIKGLVDKTKAYRESKFSDLDEDKQNSIKRLNRFLIEEVYPDKTPRSRHYFQFDEKDIEFIITPQEYVKDAIELGYPILPYEYLVL
ncbi:MAG TPA: abortive infection system antitoxin AbiGi family protein [Candidatus Wujingus californicus]|uniref:abortive infection system antitoxin AbiGi family protein n=1 Tax=Candidatus Wujingus californicus TaxID=3367618 RepID=UPI00402704BF